MVIPNDTTFLGQICEDLKKDLLAMTIQGQLMSHHRINDFSNDHVKFEFQDALFYHDGLLYVFNGPSQLQVGKCTLWCPLFVS